MNHMGIEKMKLLACKCVYWYSINADIEKYIKQCATCLEFQQMQPKEKIIHHDVPLRTWEVVRTDIFHFNNINYFCVVDYNSKFPIVRKLQGLSAEHFINAATAIFAEYGILYKIMSDTDTTLFQRGSDSSASQSMWSKLYHQHTTIKVTGRLRPASNL